MKSLFSIQTGANEKSVPNSEGQTKSLYPIQTGANEVCTHCRQGQMKDSLYLILTGQIEKSISNSDRVK